MEEGRGGMSWRWEEGEMEVGGGWICGGRGGRRLAGSTDNSSDPEVIGN